MLLALELAYTFAVERLEKGKFDLKNILNQHMGNTRAL